MNERREGAPFQMIVLALDGSEGSKRAVPFAAALAQSSGGKIVIAHVQEQGVARGSGGSRPDAEEEDARHMLERQAEELVQQGIATSLELGTVAGPGGPAHAINEIAEEKGADVIVTGTRGHSGVAGLLLGSVTQRLLHIARCPVLAVPPGVDRSPT